MNDRTCAYPGCTNLGEPGVYRRLKYCGDVCRDRDKWRNRKVRAGVPFYDFAPTDLCGICGEVIGQEPYKPFGEGAKHNRCFEHGSENSYRKRDCRCEDCVAAFRAFNDEATRKRRDANPGYSAARNARRRVERLAVAPGCRFCGEPVLGARLPEGEAAHHECRPGGAAKIAPTVRQLVYERDGFKCHLCGLRVDMGLASPARMSASLDHVVPRSHGGSDDPENLRLAHRLCNSIRRGLPVAEARVLIRSGDTALLV